MTTIKFFDYCYLPSYDSDELNGLADQDEELNTLLMNLFLVNLKHKSHLTTHYEELTEEFGPLRYLQTLRYNFLYVILPVSDP